MADWRAGKGDGGAAGGEALPMARPTQVALQTGRALALSVGWAQPAPPDPKEWWVPAKRDPSPQAQLAW